MLQDITFHDENNPQEPLLKRLPEQQNSIQSDLNSSRDILLASLVGEANSSSIADEPKIGEIKSSTEEKKAEAKEERTEPVTVAPPIIISAPRSPLELFLADKLEMKAEQIAALSISQDSLRILFTQESSCIAWLKWCRVDHTPIRWSLYPLLSTNDIRLQLEQKCCESRTLIPLEGRSLLLSERGLRKVYGVQGFINGIRDTIFGSVRYFIYAAITYRLVDWMLNGQPHFTEFQQIFRGTSEKGIDSLIGVLTQLPIPYLKLLLCSPLLLGTAKGLFNLRKARQLQPSELKGLVKAIRIALKKPGSFWREALLEMIFLASSCYGLADKIERIEQLARWDGRLSPEWRRKLFKLIEQTAMQRGKVTQLKAMSSLAKIAHGTGFKDLQCLAVANYSKQQLETLLYMKAKALEDLSQLTDFVKPASWVERSRCSKARLSLVVLPRRIYASYLLWWLGLSVSIVKQKTPFTLWKVTGQQTLFFLFKAAFLALQAYIFGKITESIILPIDCPAVDPYEYAGKTQSWGSTYSKPCFSTRMQLFRTIDRNESIDALIAEIPRYSLTTFTKLTRCSDYHFYNSLYLFSCYSLTLDEAARLIQAL